MVEEDDEEEERVGGPGEAHPDGSSVREGDGDTVRDRTGSGDCVLKERGEAQDGVGGTLLEESGSEGALVVRRGGGNVVSVKNGGHEFGEGASEGVSTGGDGQTSVHVLSTKSQVASRGIRTSSLEPISSSSNRSSSVLQGSTRESGLSPGASNPSYSFRRTFFNIHVVGFFFFTPMVFPLYSFASGSPRGFLLMLRSSTASQGTCDRHLLSHFCFTPLDKSNGCWIQVAPKDTLGAQSLLVFRSSHGLRLSLSSLPDKLQTGELL